MVKTKIVATLGPSSEKKAVLVKMMRAGMDIVRLNFSHGTLKEHAVRIKQVREINRIYRRNILILGDLEGYRIRIGRIKDKQGVLLKKGASVGLTTQAVLGSATVLPFDYAGSLQLIKKGRQIFIDDGNIALEVVGHKKNLLLCRVLVGGIVKEHKGINMPEVDIDIEGVTAQDKRHLEFCVQNRIDFLAQSFVRNKKDILALRQEMGRHPFKPRIIAKIENREGINNINSIVEVSDGIMVARGDMGVSIPIYEVPMVQKDVIRRCNKAGKMVITATQMLESMVLNLRPTRAEVSDVANAVLDGTDALMLSAETAVGLYPETCVDMMNKIIKYTEQSRLK